MSSFKKIIALTLAAVTVIIMQTAVFAYTGSGAEDDPYIITDYKEFADLSQANVITTSYTATERWYKLGSNISSTVNSIDDYTIVIGNNAGFESIIHLDLNGYTMSRSGKTTDHGMFVVYSGKLIIDDSAGNGKITCDIGTDSNNRSAMIYCEPRLSYFPNSDVIINGGTFSTPNNRCSLIYSSGMNGTITINDGTFSVGSVRTDYIYGSDSKTNVAIKGGTFSTLYFSDLGNEVIYECTVTKRIWTSNRKLKDAISSSSTVVNNGSTVTNLDIQELTNQTVITSPDRHTITYAANGGGGEMSQDRCYKGDVYTFPQCKFTAPEGHYFNGWKYAGRTYDAGETITVSGDMTVTAQWKAKEYIVSFITGCDFIVPEQKVQYGSCAEEPAAPCCFDGKYVVYWKDANGDKFDFDTPITANTLLYAYWENISNSIGTGLKNGQNYVAYYGDEVIVKESKARTNTATWTVIANGRTLLVQTLDSGTVTACIIPSKAVPANSPADVIFKNTMSVNGREFPTTTTIHLTYVYKPGDIDGSGTVSNTDAAILLKHISGKQKITDTDVLARADMDRNGKYDMRDAVAILNKAN